MSPHELDTALFIKPIKYGFLLVHLTIFCEVDQGFNYTNACFKWT